MAIEQDLQASSSQLSLLTAALSEQKPCSGIVPVPPESLNIFHGAGNDFRRLNLGTATSRDLEDLAHSYSQLKSRCSCSPNTSVHPISLPPGHFTPTLDLNNLGILHSLQTELLGARSGGTFFVKPRRLTVYGASSYPQEKIANGDSSASSPYVLIIIYPSLHTGGDITIHGNGRCWTLDTEAIGNSGRPHVGYIAFPADHTYEVSSVSSGDLVISTYELYPKSDLVPYLNPVQTTSLPHILSNLLSDTSFLPDGGLLGFQLVHPYSLAQEINNTTDMLDRTRRLRSKPLNHDILKSLGSSLVGQDAAIYQTCRDMGLEATVSVIYRTRKATLMCDHIVDFGFEEVWEEEDVILTAGGIIIDVADHYQDYFEYRRDRSGRRPGSYTVNWVNSSAAAAKNKIVTPYVSCKDRRRLALIDAEICLMVGVGASGVRTSNETTPTSSGPSSPVLLHISRD